MTTNWGNYLDYLNFMISENYANYWKFELERDNTPVHQYKADRFLAVADLLEDFKVKYLDVVKTDDNYDGLLEFIEYVSIKSDSFETTSIEFFTINLIILSLIELFQRKQVP